MKNSIDVLNLDGNLNQKLKDNNIGEVGLLCTNNRKKLKSLGLTDIEIRRIIICLELKGFDLSRK